MTFYLCINLTYPNLKILRLLQNGQLLDYQFLRRLFTNYTFFVSGVRVKRNLKALLIKATEIFGSKVGREILNIINESLIRSHCAK